MRQVWVGRVNELPTDARDLLVAVGRSDWAGVSEVTARRAGGAPSSAAPPTTPPASKAPAGSGYAWQIAQLKARFGDRIKITSTTDHSTKTVSGNVSYHVKGQAVDVVTTNGLSMSEVFNWISATYPTSAELIYTPAGGAQIKNAKRVGYSGIYDGAVASTHKDHIHWAWTGK